MKIKLFFAVPDIQIVYMSIGFTWDGFVRIMIGLPMIFYERGVG